MYMQNFNDLNLPETLLQSLAKLNYKKPTPIQEKAIPLALDGRDILGSAQTGTGKTGAFGIALVAHLIKNPESNALVITPTRELATQVMTVLESFIDREFRHSTALLIGGAPMFRQLKKLRYGPRLIVGTPGRINDHLKRKSLTLENADFLVLDETDRMLDMGFSVQINDIMKFMPQKRQTLLFSATLPKHIVNITDKYLSKPVRISVANAFAPADKISHETVTVAHADKYNQLTKELTSREGSILIFVKTKVSADRIATKLRKEKFAAEAIHGDLNHRKRENVIRAFRAKKSDILVATDVASRGLDIPHIKHVINFDLPQCPEDYIHRIGRTARADAKGSAVCFITSAEKGKWRIISELMDPSSKKEPDLQQRNSSFKGAKKRTPNDSFTKKRGSGRFKKQKWQKAKR
jgi:ATP-dependent RNA helicase DeaD